MKASDWTGLFAFMEQGHVDAIFFLAAYPVGSIFQTTDVELNPAEEYGGEWELLTQKQDINVWVRKE